MSLCNANINRAISIADYILEEGGHSVEETAKEFKIWKTTVQRDLNYLGAYAFYNNPKIDTEDLKRKYLMVQKTLEKIKSRNKSIARKKASIWSFFLFILLQ